MKRGFFGSQFWSKVKVMCLVLALLSAGLEAVQGISWQQTGSMPLWTCLLLLFLGTHLEVLPGSIPLYTLD